MPGNNQKVDLDAEDALIERQLQEAQERIAYLKAQVAKERKLRLQLRKKSTTGGESKHGNEAAQMEAVQSTLEASLLTTASTDSAPETRERPKTSSSNGRADKKTNKNMSVSASQPTLSTGARPRTAAGLGSGSGVSAARSLSSSTSKKSKRHRPKTASSHSSQTEYLNRLSPSKPRPSTKHHEKAKAMPYKKLKELMHDKLFQEAVKRKGCHDYQLQPRPVASFRRQPNRAALLPMDVAQLNFEAYEMTRVNLLGMVLQEFDVCMEQMREEEAKVNREQQKLAKVFTKQIGGEEGKMRKITANRHKIENVTVQENRLLKARRKKFEKSHNKSKNAQTKYLEKLKMDRERREERGRKQQEKIAAVSGMKDSMLQARNQIMEDRFRQRDARIKHTQDEKKRLAKMKQDMSASGKDDRSKRQRHATKVRAMKMKRLMVRLHEKEEHVRLIQQKKKKEVEALRVRKTLNMKRRIDNVNRARREQEYVHINMID